MSPDAKQSAIDRLRANNAAMQSLPTFRPTPIPEVKQTIFPAGSAPETEQKEDLPRMPDPRTACGNSPMEAGSPEFAEDRTQVNSLNNKRMFDEFQDLGLAAARRSQVNFDNLQQISLRALNNSVDFQAQVNQRALAGFDQTQTELASINAQKLRHADNANYITTYDLANPVATGAGDALRSAAYTPNRATDVSASGVSVSAEAVSAAVANAINGTIPTLQAAIGAAIAAALVNTPTKPAA